LVRTSDRSEPAHETDTRGPNPVYGFLTTAPNAVVEPIHPKAMPVILRADDEWDVWNARVVE